MTEIYLEKENKTIQKELEKPIKLRKLLKELNISIESVILTKNDEITLEDEDVCNTDKIKILTVVSGG
jgi:sulfur carrier protein ThiS